MVYCILFIKTGRKLYSSELYSWIWRIERKEWNFCINKIILILILFNIIFLRSNDYIVGAREYFESSIKLNQLLRSVMDNKSFFKANGDIAKEPWPYSQRVKVLETFLNAQKFVN